MTNSKQGIVNIHGKEYMTVAQRLILVNEEGKLKGVKSEVLSHNPVVIRVTATIDGIEYQGTSAANPNKTIEKQSPYEVAETSALGRALGFAGYGLIDSIASADEIVKASQPVARVDAGLTYERVEDGFSDEPPPLGEPLKAVNNVCEKCGAEATERKGVSKAGKSYHGIFCSTENKAHTKWLSV